MNDHVKVGIKIEILRCDWMKWRQICKDHPTPENKEVCEVVRRKLVKAIRKVKHEDL